MSLEKGKNESYSDYKWRMLLDKRKEESDYTWEEIHEALNLGLGIDSIKKGTIFLPEFEEYMIQKFNNNEKEVKYKESLELKGDGTRTSDKLISIAKAQDITEEFLLSAHGFNTDEFELVSAKNSIWNVSAGKDPNKTLYSSKISVKTKVNGFNMDKVIEKLNKNVKPHYIERNDEKAEEKLLNIPFFDMHFGIATLSTYEKTTQKTLEKIKSRKWSNIVFVIGQDLIHTDGFTGQTTSGTIIGKVDVEQAWIDAFTFYSTLIEEAIVNSNNVNIVFSNGNHDQAMGWAFVKALEVAYPQVKFDTRMKQFKAVIWKEIFIGITHGDKGHNRIQKVFLSEYGNLIAKAKVKEIISGHLHHEKSKDDFGIVQRTLGSGVPTDDYHADNGFVGAMKRFQLFEYSTDSLDSIYYV